MIGGGGEVLYHQFELHGASGIQFLISYGCDRCSEIVDRLYPEIERFGIGY